MGTSCSRIPCWRPTSAEPPEGASQEAPLVYTHGHAFVFGATVAASMSERRTRTFPARMVPTLGRSGRNSFQCLENSRPIFPNIGNFITSFLGQRRHVQHWKDMGRRASGPIHGAALRFPRRESRGMIPRPSRYHAEEPPFPLRARGAKMTSISSIDTRHVERPRGGSSETRSHGVHATCLESPSRSSALQY